MICSIIFESKKIRDMNKEGRSIKYLKLLGKYLIELMIVFIGVFAAYQISEYQSNIKKQERLKQIKIGLMKEIGDVTFRTERAEKFLGRMVKNYDSLIVNGEMPNLQPFYESVEFRPFIWEATLQMDGLDILEPTFIFQVSKLYNSLYQGAEEINRLRKLSEEILIPNIEKGKGEFYNLKTKKLKQKYEWYINGIQKMLLISRDITSLGKELQIKLKSNS